MAKILVADDHYVNRQLLVYLLKHQGHVVIEACNGAEALVAVHSESPDLVIADIVMPVMDGYEFVRALRTEASICHTQVLFYTAAYREDEAKKLAEAHGVIGLLTKPIDPKQVIVSVANALQLSQAVEAPPLPTSSSVILEEQHRKLVANKLAEKVIELESEIMRRQEAEEALRRVNQELEQRVRDRTRELEAVNRALLAEIAERNLLQQEREQLIVELRQSLAEVKTLNGLLPVCAWCKKFRDDQGYWSEVEEYIRRHTLAKTTHGICPDCMAKVESQARLYEQGK